MLCGNYTPSINILNFEKTLRLRNRVVLCCHSDALLFVVSNIVSRFCSLNVILKFLNMSVLPRSLGTSSESANDVLMRIIVSSIFILILCVYAGIRIFPIPTIGRYSPW